MSGKRSRTKGANGEREAAAMLDAVLGWKMRRVLEQPRSKGRVDLEPQLDAGGDPIEGTPAIGVEVKGGGHVPKFPYAALAQGDADLLMMRRHNQEWLLCLTPKMLGSLLEWARREGANDPRA